MTDDLKDAFRAVRERYDGEHPEADATLNRALFRQRALDRKRRVTRWVVLPIAAAFVASTAWASVTGHLPKAISSLIEPTRTEHEASPSAPVNVPVPVPVHIPPVNDPLPEPAAVPEPPPVAPVIATSPAHAPPARSAKPTPVATTTASTNDPHAALFADAHRIHFIEKDPGRAIAAWDAYLAAAPHGRFAPEARYNRALALVRLGHHAEAKKELETFANGAFGGYRQSEARALLDALARDE
jgi:hypothetical protein